MFFISPCLETVSGTGSDSIRVETAEGASRRKWTERRPGFAILKLHARGIVPLLRRESARAHGSAVYLRAARDAAAPRAGGVPAGGAVWVAEDDGRDSAMPRRSAGDGHARGAAADRRGPGAGFRIARLGTVDRGLLLRAAGRCAAWDAAACGGDAARGDLVADP